MIFHNVSNFPFVFIGIIFIFIGWFSIITGLFGFLRAEDLFIVTFKIESMVVDTRFVPESHIAFHLAIRIIIGFFILFIGNSILFRGLSDRHSHICHPRIGDFAMRRLRQL